MLKKTFSYAIICVIIPAVVITGTILFKEKQTAWIALCVAVLSCIPFFLGFERRKTDVASLVLVAVMTALSVVGRAIFTIIPGFKPVTAITVITGIYFGPSAGFLTGAASAVISNFYFGQGPWTPFQMLAWGMVGFIAGIAEKPLKRHFWILLIFGVLAGVLYSVIMDIYSVLWFDGRFNFYRFIAMIASSFPATKTYMISNGIFLFILAKPFGKILSRIKAKNGI